VQIRSEGGSRHLVCTRCRVRVVTLNVWTRKGDWDARRGVIRAELRELEPDLVAFQETIVLDGYDQVRDLLDGSFAIAHQGKRQGNGMGVSIASRWPIREVREIDQHVTERVGEFPATTLIADIDVPGDIGRVLFVNHFPSWEPGFERERELQTVAAVRALEETAGHEQVHVVLAGDLDAAPESSSIRFLSGRQSLHGMSVLYADAWGRRHSDDDGETFTTRNPLQTWSWWPFQRIDYIFVRCDNRGRPTLRIRESARVFDEPRNGVWASDHFGVLADLDAPAD
jgi:endonuclease/exonuclease/phosphatase family metal-dependent hydrolase